MTINITPTEDTYAEDFVQQHPIIVGKPLKIIRMGAPILRKTAELVEDPMDEEIQQIIVNMMATINQLGPENVAGLAAPQVDIPLRIILFQIPKDKPNGTRYKGKFIIAINPKIELLSDEKELGYEGCLSIPGLMAEVSRYKHIQYTYQTATGNSITREAHDYHARVVQHEVDHLDGILYLERMQNMKNIYFNEEFQQLH